MAASTSSPAPLSGEGSSTPPSLARREKGKGAGEVGVSRLLLKTLLLYLIANLLLVPISPAALGRPTLYNTLLPGRARFPFGENPQKSYNLSLYNLEAMFRSHEIAGAPKTADEYRVVLIGDSSVWGTLLRPGQTLSGQLNALSLNCAGKNVRVFNLGYPTISLAKDVLILRRALAYRPDLVIWPVTLEAFPRGKQLASPLAANNAAEIRALGLKGLDESALVAPTFWDRTLIGQRRALADLFRLQMYGVMWAATGIDQEYPARYTPAQLDLEADESYSGWKPGDADFLSAGLAWDVLSTGFRIAEDAGVPVLLVNEPMLISNGRNSSIRYNFFYPRWAYDAWRAELAARARAGGWSLFDAWNLLPPSEFTNSAIHLTPTGQAEFAGLLGQQICPAP